MTAAHCVFTVSTIYIAYVNFTDIFDETYQVEVPIVSALPHPGYDGNFPPLDNDIALLQLEFSVYDIEPVAINNITAIPADNAAVTVFGIGFLEEFKNETEDEVPLVPTVLQVVQLDITPNDVCIAEYEKSLNSLSVDPDLMMCAAAPGKVSRCRCIQFIAVNIRMPKH
jgi:hypothetical protein